MSNFLDKFPKIPYNISGNKPANYDFVTNIFFRFSVLRDVVNNISAYEEYTIKEDETPEILASKYYGDPEAYWLILYANDIYDPQYDWPLNQKNFTNYIETKYGSVANSQAQMHHYEKVVGRQVENSDEFFFTTYKVNYSQETITIVEVGSYTGAFDEGDIVYQSTDRVISNTTFAGVVSSFSGSNNMMILTNVTGNYTSNTITYNYTKGGSPAPILAPPSFFGLDQQFPDPTVPFECYVNLPPEPTTYQYTLNGKVISEVIGRRAVSCYDYESELNEKKRNIKLIRKQYYGPIITEFGNLTNSIPGYIRRLRSKA